MRAALVDTSVAVDHLCGHPKATEILRSVFSGEGHVFMSVLSQVEIRAGIKAAEAEKIERFFDLFAGVPVDDDVAGLAGQLAWKFRRSHPELDVVDYIIAAQVIKGDFRLITATVDRYPILDGLTAAY